MRVSLYTEAPVCRRFTPRNLLTVTLRLISGLGKTVQACALLKCYSDQLPALIIVPSSMRDTWADALNKYVAGSALHTH